MLLYCGKPMNCWSSFLWGWVENIKSVYSNMHCYSTVSSLNKKTLNCGLTQHILKNALCNTWYDRPISYYLHRFLDPSFLLNNFLLNELTVSQDKSLESCKIYDQNPILLEEPSEVRQVVQVLASSTLILYVVASYGRPHKVTRTTQKRSARLNAVPPGDY